MEARFSLEYVIADALINGGVALENYSEAPVDAVIAALAARVTRQPDPTAPADELDPDRRFHRVTLWLRDGRTLSHCVTRRETAAAFTDVEAKCATALRHCLPRRRKPSSTMPACRTRRTAPSYFPD